MLLIPIGLQVALRDVTLIIGVNHHHLLNNYVSVMHKDVMRGLGELYQPGARWIKKHKRRRIRNRHCRYWQSVAAIPSMVATICLLLEEKPPAQTRDMKNITI